MAVVELCAISLNCLTAMVNTARLFAYRKEILGLGEVVKNAKRFCISMKACIEGHVLGLCVKYHIFHLQNERQP